MGQCYEARMARAPSSNAARSGTWPTGSQAARSRSRRTRPIFKARSGLVELQRARPAVRESHSTNIQDAKRICIIRCAGLRRSDGGWLSTVGGAEQARERDTILKHLA